MDDPDFAVAGVLAADAPFEPLRRVEAEPFPLDETSDAAVDEVALAEDLAFLDADAFPRAAVPRAAVAADFPDLEAFVFAAVATELAEDLAFLEAEVFPRAVVAADFPDLEAFAIAVFVLGFFTDEVFALFAPDGFPVAFAPDDFPVAAFDAEALVGFPLPVLDFAPLEALFADAPLVPSFA